MAKNSASQRNYFIKRNIAQYNAETVNHLDLVVFEVLSRALLCFL